METNHILFFDGFCNLCNGAVRVLLKIDKKRKMKVASLQGETARNLGIAQGEVPESILLFSGNKIYSHHEAVFQTLRIVGGVFKILLVFEILPDRWNKKIYAVIASRRYRWFGKRSTCRMPSPEERERFLP